MYARWLAGHGVRVIAAALVTAAVLSGFGPGAASAAACVSWTGVQPPSPSSSLNNLTNVAVASSCRAWAVGYYYNGSANQTLIEAWNGSSWAQQPSPDPGGFTTPNFLWGATATSASNAWAVGWYSSGTANQTLIEHWNGTIWAQEPSPNPSPSSNVLSGVAATSASNAWAVGRYHNGAADQTLIERWNGTTWTRVSSPNPGGARRENVLLKVTATSASNAWAVGYYNNGTADKTLIEHWNGTAWKQVPSPDPSSSENVLLGVAATSATDAWAVGYYAVGRASQTLVAHWNGTAWAQVPSPNPSPTSDVLFGVDATSASNIWAVGYYHTSTGYRALALHCC